MKFNIVFMGTPEFSVPTLKALIENKFNILKVYTQPPKKSKRGQRVNSSPIENFCKENKLDFNNPFKLDNEEEIKKFKKLSPDLVVVVAYGQIIPKNYLEIPKLGFINVHASLLPKWRGAAPIQRAIMNEDKKIGISIMKIQEQLDTGPVFCSKELDLDKNLTHGEIEKKIAHLGAELLIKNIKSIEIGKAEYKKQVHSEATYAKKIDKAETKINWHLDANKVLGHIHALSPNPGAWFEFENERFKVLRAKITNLNGKPSSTIDENLTIACKSNSIQILELQRQGKNKQTSKEFLLGKKIKVGSIFN
jgi:methionyl-tRNA formyltransferase